jgi:hypothetical protein
MGLELGDLLVVDVHDHDVISEVREASRRGEPNIPGADDSNFAQSAGIIS